MRDLKRRLEALEAQRPASRVVGPLSREARETVIRTEAAIVAVHLGHWKEGDDAFEAFERGLLSTTPTHCTPDLTYALMQAEWQRFGGYSTDEALERLDRLWAGAGDACQAVYDRLDGILNSWPELDWAGQSDDRPASIMGQVGPVVIVVDML